MTFDGTTILVIVMMGLVTYLTRVTGLIIAGRGQLTGLAESLAGVVTILAAFRLPLLGTVVVGVTAVVLLRLALG